MGSIHNPIGSGPKDPYDKTIHVEPVDEDKLTKQDKQKEPDELPPNEKWGIAAFVLQMFHKMVDLFLKNPGALKSGQTDPWENLISLKTSFEILKKEDRSQDLEFLNHLSLIWRRALEDALHFKSDSAVLKFKVLVRKIQHYPENHPHTFGYYLSENTHQKWIPFPYMELVQKIHIEHQKNPGSSALLEWTRLIDELLILLKLE